ncbi:hypothetical protein [Sphingomonas mesophila]|uniref:hypothetical protein n=1 Tax=Sphingomonas mesophila TaxID=2303576 RepID=UPI000E591BA6|nr:hypothetical protein [Sphingomonas mesophila]
MRTLFLILIIAVLAVIAAIATNFLNINQTRDAQVPRVSATENGVTASGGQAPAFDVQTGTVSVGAQPANVTVPLPRVTVNPPASTNQAAPATPPTVPGNSQ